MDVPEKKSMDPIEKIVLRRRKPAIVEAVTINDVMLAEIQTSGLLTPENIQQVKSEVSASLRIHKLVELILVSTAEGAFELTIQILSKNYLWLSRNLEADLKIEKGDYFVEDDIQKEASMLVHRKFGTSKRLCEGDKKDISDLIGLKLQITKEEHERDLDKINDILKEEVEKNKTKDKLTRQLAERMKLFVKKNRAQLTTHAHGMRSTTEALQLSLEETEKDLLEKYSGTSEALFDRLAKVLQHKDALMSERDRCFKKLGEKDEKLGMDEALAKWMMARDAAASLASSKATSRAGSATGSSENRMESRRLNKRITDLEHEVMDKDEALTDLKTEIVSRENEMANLKARIEELEKEKDAAAAQQPQMNGTASVKPKRVIKTKPRPVTAKSTRPK